MAKWCAKWRIKLNPEKTKVIIFSRFPLARKSEPVLKLYGERLKIYPQVKFLGITFDSKLTFQKLAKWCAKWRIKLNPEKTKVIIFSRFPLARKSEPVLKLYGERLKIYPQVKFLGITFDSKLTFQKLAKWCAKWRIKLNPEKTKVIIFSRFPLARKSEPVLKLYGERLKIYPQVKFLGITFDSKLTFQKHFEEILGRCNTRYHRVRLIVNKKWGPSPSTILQIYKQCVRPIFEYGSLSTNNVGHDHQQNSTATEQVYPTCPAFTKIH